MIFWESHRFIVLLTNSRKTILPILLAVQSITERSDNDIVLFPSYYRRGSGVSGRPGESTVGGRPGAVCCLCDCRSQHVLLRAASRHRETEGDPQQAWQLS